MTCEAIVLEWILWLVAALRVWYVHVQPSYKYFSIARHPSARSAEQPEGLDIRDPETFAANHVFYKYHIHVFLPYVPLIRTSKYK